MNKKIMCFMLIGLMLVSSGSVTFGASSDEQFATVYSHDYSFYNSAHSLGLGARANVSVYNEDGTGGIAAGYMGGNAKLYYSSGILSKSTGMQYTEKYMVGMVWYTDYTTLSGKYYAKSQVAFYNGNGYDKYDVNKSPIVTYSSSNGSAEEIDKFKILDYKINQSGETYGSELYSEVYGELPDLIAARGTNGIIGYVRNSDLNPEPTTIKEALALNNVTEIPLYNLDGKTIIGKFEFSGGSHPIE